MQKLHAQHNENVCNFIHNSGKEYYDWIVTTAFYSALHYVQHEIFPLSIESVKHNCFDDYYSSLAGIKPSKHEVTHQLVTRYLNKASGPYRFLLDNCKNARYKNYNISEPFATAAINRLSLIKEVCKK